MIAQDPQSPPKTAVLQSLTRQVRSLETANRHVHSNHRISSGSAAMDAMLPDGGYASGSLVEFLADPHGGCGTMTLMMIAAHSAVGRSTGGTGNGNGNGTGNGPGNGDSTDTRAGKYIVVVDPTGQFYPLAAISFGIDPAMLIVLHPTDAADQVWAVDQSLRCPAVGAVVSRFDDLDDRDARRFQLAAEESGALGLFRRVDTGGSLPSWAEIQWRVQPMARPLPNLSSGVDDADRNSRWIDLQLARCRNGRGADQRVGRRIQIVIDGDDASIRPAAQTGRAATAISEISHERASTLCLAAELAMPTHRSNAPRTDRASDRSQIA